MTATDASTELREGYFGAFGGQFVPESLSDALAQLVDAWADAEADAAFGAQLDALRRDYGGRPTPLYHAARLSEVCGLEVWLKREDLAHTGSHKLNNVVGQALLAQRMGKPRVIAETGAGQHGVATATAAALFGLRCTVYMGAEDCRRQRLNVVRMQLLGAEVVPVESGTRTLKDAINEAMRDWVTNVDDTHYLIGSAMGPHPFPTIVRELQKVISVEDKEQFATQAGGVPDAVIACVGGGSNAIGSFAEWIDVPEVRLIGIEAAGEGVGSGRSAATISEGREAVLHGSRSIVLVDDDGQVRPAHSVSAGLDYPGVGPEHAWLASSGRGTYLAATDEDALEGFRRTCELEGIIPALEPAHAVGWLLRHGRAELGEGARVVLTMSGRGDKDVDEVVEVAGWDLGVARAFGNDGGVRVPAGQAGTEAATETATEVDADGGTGVGAEGPA
ncbi:tryptophan synthase subunit beta [Egicoccus halophilus]|uniref:Tryptophan synthase beta chain n=1 Tax=Egicoccus halophilus TaxID=1670830 RepID=A0A8J3A892_9ACTN|nr:tryptophan synthase subunit beta [Egicoccus halophilus]GGI04399.1 tryptophan synthase beta chain [Egicoccus halophilus]